MTLDNIYNQETITFLQQNPLLLNSLLATCEHNLDNVSNLIEKLLQSPQRCELASFYIQAMTKGGKSFLATNLAHKQSVQLTASASNWLLGRNSICQIFIPNHSVSRRHALIGYFPESGFYITDIGSTNGTRVNYSKINPLQRCLLQDGDLIQLGAVKLEFFVNDYQEQLDCQHVKH